MYYSNRAAVNLALGIMTSPLFIFIISIQIGNFGKVIADCAKAIEINPKNIKAHWREAKAYNQLGKYRDCIAICDKALDISSLLLWFVFRCDHINQDKENKELLAEKKIAIEKQVIEERKALERQKQEADAKREEQAVIGFIEAKGMTMGEPLFDISGYLHLNYNYELNS